VRRQLYFEISAAALSAILLEVAYTRIFSFKVYYCFTYLVIGIALMGLGVGGALVTGSRRLAQTGLERLVPRACLFGAACVLFGYVVAARVQLNASALASEPVEVG
jgi:hypothetical protein